MLTRPDSERGFTLIEMVIAAVLLVIVIAVASSMLKASTKGAQDSAAQRRVQVQANRVLEELGTDLRGAAAPARLDVNQTSTRTRLQLGLAMVIAGNDDFEDIGLATGDEVAFRADAIAEGTGVTRNIECVSFRVEPDADGERLVRRVWSNAYPCPGGGGAAATRTMTKLRATPGSPVFRYVLAQPIPGAPDPVCQPLVQNAVTTPAGRLRIVGVQVNLRGLSRDATSIKSLDTSGSIDVWSRLTGDYQFAIGCAA